MSEWATPVVAFSTDVVPDKRETGLPRIGLTPVDRVEACVRNAVTPIVECVIRPIDQASGWTTARDHYAKLALPLFSQSAVDGYALTGDGVSFEVTGLCRAGETYHRLNAGQAAHVMTGAPVPDGADRIVLQEHVSRSAGRIEAPRVEPGANIRRRGDDVTRGQLTLAAGQRLDAGRVALLAASGHDAVACVRALKIAVVSTGAELDLMIGPGKIRDSNTPMLASLFCAAPDIEVAVHHVGDDSAALAGVLASLLPETDLVITTGGMSSGIEDHVRDACRSLGGHFVIEGVTMKPGKPVGLAKFENALLLGLPGNPFAALATFAVVGRPLLAQLRGRTTEPPTPAIAGFSLERKQGRTEFFPARRTGYTNRAAPIVERLGKGGSARLAPFSIADGLGVIDANVERVVDGDAISFLDFTAAWRL